jgi:uncharacterized protein YciI
MENTLFVIVLRYLVELDELDQYLVSHRAFLDQHYATGMLIASGPQRPRNGGIILARAASREQLWAVMQHDPFYQHQCAEYNIYEFSAIKHSAAFAEVLKERIK